MAKLKNVYKKMDLAEVTKDRPDLAEQVECSNLQDGVNVSVYIKTDLVEISSDHYMVVDIEVLNTIKNEISVHDYTRLFSLGVFLKTRFNILFNHTRPFTLETLSEKLGINKDNTVKFVRRMVEKGIMAYTVCAPSGYIEKIYSINPQLIRRGKCYDKEYITTYFKVYDKTFKEGVEIKLTDKPSKDSNKGIQPNTDF